jgi:hypothetical protein
VNGLINRLDALHVKGKSQKNEQVILAMRDERTAIKNLLKCSDRDVRVAARLIESLARVIDASDGQPWLSPPKSPSLEIVKPILLILRLRLTRVEEPGKPSGRAQGKQAQDDQEGHDDNPTIVIDD